MITLPDGLEVKEPTNYLNTGEQFTRRPMFGSIGSQSVEFRTEKIYNEPDSVKEGREVFRDVELCYIRSDRFSNVPLRVADPEKGIKGELSREQEVALTNLYSSWKDHKDSGETNILDWKAISRGDMANLAHLGFWTVEPIAKIGDYELHRLGPGGADLREKARRHVRSKLGDKALESESEMHLLRQEMEELKAQLVEKQEAEFAKHAALAGGKKPKKKTSKKPKAKPVIEETPAVEAAA